MQHRMAVAERSPDGGVLRTKERGHGRSDGGGNMHGSAVMAEKHVELRGERGELADRQRAVEGDNVRFRVRTDLRPVGSSQSAC